MTPSPCLTPWGVYSSSFPTEYFFKWAGEGFQDITYAWRAKRRERGRKRVREEEKRGRGEEKRCSGKGRKYFLRCWGRFPTHKTFSSPLPLFFPLSPFFFPSSPFSFPSSPFSSPLPPFGSPRVCYVLKTFPKSLEKILNIHPCYIFTSMHRVSLFCLEVK